MALPTISGSFMPVLKCLYEKNTVVSNDELKDCMREYFKPSEEDLNIYTKTGHNSFDNRSHWAVVSLKQAELVERPIPRHVQITEAGRKFFEENPEFTLRTLKDKTPYLQNEYKNRQEQEDEEPSDEEMSLDLSADDHYQSVEEEILRRLKNVGENSADKGRFFEEKCLELLEKMGYGKGERTGGSGDRGIDGFLIRDPLGFERIGIQCKCYTDSKVDDNEITKFAHGLKNVHGCTQGVFLTTSDFLPRAKKAAEETKDIKIILIHGIKLAELMRKHQVGVKIKETKYIYDIDL